MSQVSPVRSLVAARRSGVTWLPATGLWLVPVGATLLGLHWIYPSGPRTAEGVARTFSSPVAVCVKEFLRFEGGMIMLLFGLLLLGEYLATGRSRRWGQWAGRLSATAGAMFLPGVGIPTQALPGISDVFLSGHREVSVVFDAFIAGHFGASFIVQFALALVVSLAGAVAVGVAGWRSRMIPRWCSIAFPVGFLLNVTDTPVIAWVGLALMVVTGTVIASRSHPRQLPSE